MVATGLSSTAGAIVRNGVRPKGYDTETSRGPNLKSISYGDAHVLGNCTVEIVGEVFVRRELEESERGEDVGDGMKENGGEGWLGWGGCGVTVEAEREDGWQSMWPARDGVQACVGFVLAPAAGMHRLFVVTSRWSVVERGVWLVTLGSQWNADRQCCPLASCTVTSFLL
ncbi:hypothetical protein K439DRAFT_1624217 [Ramaria rubella]|nr:hypothetical protein K439DRAFT_1624217 [Ramaria rubella]